MISAEHSLGASSLLVMLAALGYLLGVARAWSKAGFGRGISWIRALAGLLGFSALAFALSPPLEALAAMLFSAHMAQHLLLVLVAAPLLVVGVPLLALLWLLPPGGRRGAVFTVRRNRYSHPLWRAVSHPLVAWLCFVLLLWAWHLPGAYEAALTNDGLHVIEHLTLTGGSALFWWAVFQPLGRRRLSRLAAPLLLFLTALQGGILGAMITLSPRPWYSHYERVAQATGLSALADQQLAGLLMWVPPATLYLGVACWMLYRGLTDVEARQGRARSATVKPLAHLNSLLVFVVALGLLADVTSGISVR